MAGVADDMDTIGRFELLREAGLLEVYTTDSGGRALRLTSAGKRAVLEMEWVGESALDEPIVAVLDEYLVWRCGRFFRVHPAVEPVLRQAREDVKRLMAPISHSSHRLQEVSAAQVSPEAWEAAEDIRTAVDELGIRLECLAEELERAVDDDEGMAGLCLASQLVHFDHVSRAAVRWTQAFNRCEAAMHERPDTWEWEFSAELLGAGINWWKVAGWVRDFFDLEPEPKQRWVAFYTPPEADVPLVLTITSGDDAWHARADYGDASNSGAGPSAGDAVDKALAPFGGRPLLDKVVEGLESEPIHLDGTNVAETHAAMDPDAELDAILEQGEAAGLIEQYVDEDGQQAMRLTPDGERAARQLTMLGEDGQDELMMALLEQAGAGRYHAFHQTHPRVLPVLRDAKLEAKRLMAPVSLSSARLQRTLADHVSPEAWEAAEDVRSAVRAFGPWLDVFIEEVESAAGGDDNARQYLVDELEPFVNLSHACAVWADSFSTVDAAMSQSVLSWEWVFSIQMLGAGVFWWLTANELQDEFDLEPEPRPRWTLHYTPPDAEHRLVVVVTAEDGGWRAVADFDGEAKTGRGDTSASAIRRSMAPFSGRLPEDLVNLLDMDDGSVG